MRQFANVFAHYMLGFAAGLALGATIMNVTFKVREDNRQEADFYQKCLVRIDSHECESIERAGTSWKERLTLLDELTQQEEED